MEEDKRSISEPYEKTTIGENIEKPTISGSDEDAKSEIYKPTICTPYEMKPLWGQSFLVVFVHIGGFYGAYLALYYAKWLTCLYSLFFMVGTGLGVTAGAHRYYAHRSYEAKRPLQLLYLFMQTLASQNDLIWWVRIHRLHHKFSDTDADRHNINRGFFYAHMGWLLVSSHPVAVRAIKTIDCSDLLADPVVRFQRKYFYYLWGIFFTMVNAVPVLLWDESWTNAIFVVGLLRILAVLHVTFCINSAAHTFGNRAYDTKYTARETALVSFLALGEGTHNYHHAFPWDYRAAEIGLGPFSITNKFLDMCHKFGWIYDVKQASSDVVIKRAMRTGDGTHPMFKELNNNRKMA